MTQTAAGLEELTCSSRSQALGEPLYGTASVISTWLFLEQAGAWPTEALASRRLPAGLGSRLARLANRHRIRVVLVRRVGRSTTVDVRPQVLVAHVRDRDPRLGRCVLGEAADVLDLDFEALGAGDAAGLEPVVEPMFCICTHGAHDQCCATYGRPVASAVASRFPADTWEVSHIGGDRFAANLACFPYGYYFGRVPSEDAGGIAADYRAGRLRLDRLRGRVCYPMVVQAAEHFLRVDRALDGVAALALRSRRTVEGTDDVQEVTFDLAAGGDAVVRVRSSHTTPPRTLTCRSNVVGRPPTYELLAITS